MSAEPIDFAAVKAEHENTWDETYGVWYCHECGANTADLPVRCSMYRLADAAEHLALQIAAVNRVLNNDNRRDNANSVAALGDHVPKVRKLIADLWLSTGAHPERVQP